MPSPAEIAPAPPTASNDAAPRGAAPYEPAPERHGELFVRAIDLPTLSLRQANAAVAQQLDILSPLPPAEVAVSVVLMGPVEEGLNRFAVAFAPRSLLAGTAGWPDRAVSLSGRLDAQEIDFRFEPPRAAASPGSRLEIATLAGVCLAIVLAGVSLRLDREIDRTQAQLDAANAVLQHRGHEAASLAHIAAAWRVAAARQGASAIDCALGDIAKASGGPVKLARLTLTTDGQLAARLSEPASAATQAALRGLGFTAGAPGGEDPAGMPVMRDFQTSGAQCQ